jgi:hypothetical protein
MFIEFLNIDTDKEAQMLNHRYPEEVKIDAAERVERSSRIKTSLEYLRLRQNFVEAEIPKTNLQRMAKRKAIASIAEDILRLERRLGVVETVTYSDPRFLDRARDTRTLKNSAVGSRPVFDCEVKHHIADVVEFQKR